jgi:hypothetical protein
MTHSLTLEIPENIYEPLAEEASAKGQSVEDLALEVIAFLSAERHLNNTDSDRLADVPADEFEKRLPDSNATLNSLDKIIGTIRSDIPDWADNHDDIWVKN